MQDLIDINAADDAELRFKRDTSDKDDEKKCKQNKKHQWVEEKRIQEFYKNRN